MEIAVHGIALLQRREIGKRAQRRRPRLRVLVPSRGDDFRKTGRGVHAASSDENPRQSNALEMLDGEAA
jgi:hypothetical protein